MSAYRIPLDHHATGEATAFVLTTTHACPHCESQLDELGVYGNRAHFSCPDCGAFMSAVVWRRIETKEDEE